MAKQSAGILVYRKVGSGIEVLIVHPGGPFWAKKDKGAWSIPKGEFTDEENPLVAAKREFAEELGSSAPDGVYQEIGQTKTKSGKIIHAWALQGDLDIAAIKSNTFEMEWPPRSGQQQQFQEVDKAAWYPPQKAMAKLNPAQVVFVERLVEALGLPASSKPEQTTLL